MFDPITSAPSGDQEFVRLNPKDLLGHLLLVWVLDYIPESPTKFTKPGDPCDVIVVDAVDLNQADPATGKPGLVGRSCWWRQAQLIRDLKDSIGKPNPKLARMQQGVATKGLPPYVLVDALGDPSAVAFATAWMRENPDFKPQPRERVSEVTISQAPRPPESELERMARLASQPQPDAYNKGGAPVYYGTDLPPAKLPPAPPLPDEPPF